MNALRYVINDVIYNDTKIPTNVEEVQSYSFIYIQKLENRVNYLAMDLLDNNYHVHRLRREDVLSLKFRNL